MKNNTFLRAIGRYWWMPLISGLIYLGLGIWTLFAPASGIPLLAYFFAAFLVANGVLNMSYTFLSGGVKLNWGWNLAVGILEGIAGVWLLCLPAPVIATAFIYVVGLWIIAVSVIALCESVMMTRYTAGSVLWLFLTSGLAIVLAIIFLTNPVAGGIVVWIWLGLALIGYGIYRCIIAITLRRLCNLPE